MIKDAQVMGKVPKGRVSPEVWAFLSGGQPHPPLASQAQKLDKTYGSMQMRDLQSL